MEKENINIFVQAVARQLRSLFGDRTPASAKASEAVMTLLGNNPEYIIPTAPDLLPIIDSAGGLNELHDTLAKLNEKELRRKKDGVYYTLPDVTNFITANAFVKFIRPDFSTILRADKISSSLDTFDSHERDRLAKATVFDPTCGSGEFLITALQYKLRLIGSEYSDDEILAIAGTISGNDIAIESVYISKIRLFFTTLPFITDPERFATLARILNENFTTEDFINADISNFGPYDIILGNPPYVEYRMLDYEPEEKLGNTYANALSNASRMLTSAGVLGFIIPISFVATKRMSPIRKIIDGIFENICLLNYADRPDCLFSGVHQKLTIIIASRESHVKGYFSSSYNYWYKQEREELFNRDMLIKVSPNLECYIPKLGNETERDIFDKCVVSPFDKSLLDYCLQTSQPATDAVYLNMRNCFWIKAFSFNPGSSEYKGFSCSSGYIDFIRCLLNSSLFFFFWIAVSDCWHITSKEMGLFKVPNPPAGVKMFSTLSKRLEERLESTKVYVGTKQTEYEYKHRFCKDIIDEIDDAIAPYYNLNHTQTEYLKNFILKYRLSDGAKL